MIDGGETGEDPLDGSLEDSGSEPPDANMSPDGAPTMDAGPEVDGGHSGCLALDGGAVASASSDVVIVLDTSPSMSPIICNVAANLQTFAEHAGPDLRLVTLYEMGTLAPFALSLCGSDDPIGSNPLTADSERYMHVATPVDSTSALAVLLSSFSAYEGFLRPGVPTHFVVVTDDESALAASEFQAQMEGLLGHPFTFHAVVAEGENGCMGFGVGTQYLALADATDGERLSICASDWGAELSTLGCAIAAP
jgi:hypothetical protein